MDNAIAGGDEIVVELLFGAVRRWSWLHAKPAAVVDVAEIDRATRRQGPGHGDGKLAPRADARILLVGGRCGRAGAALWLDVHDIDF
jgi:hypothetical protein